nr:dna repair protein rhp26 [Quercus suber]POF04899.1 dna repair protein rhp26 [Quercus suber]
MSSANNDQETEEALAKVEEKQTDEPTTEDVTLQDDEIPAGADEATQLAALATGVRDQDDLERDIGRQADQLLQEQADERDKKRLEKTGKQKELLLGQIHSLEHKLTQFGNSTTKNKYRDDIKQYKEQIAGLDSDLQQIQKRMDDRHGHDDDAPTAPSSASNQPMPGESQRDFLIRTGKITPFSKMGARLLRTSSSLGDVLLEAEGEDADEDETLEVEVAASQGQAGPKSHRNLLAPGFAADSARTPSPVRGATGDTANDEEIARKLQEEEYASERPMKRRRLQTRRQAQATDEESDNAAKESEPLYSPEEDETDPATASDDGFIDAAEGEGEVLATTPGLKRKSRARGQRSSNLEAGTEDEDLAGIDDGNEQVYKTRLQSWVRRRSAARRKFQQSSEVSTRDSGAEADSDDIKQEMEESLALGSVDEAKDEWHMPHPSRTDAEFEGNFKIPGDIYPSLFDYQKTGVQWLWELYTQQVGGIIGDEMGLGKTIQAISFLAGLHYSGKLSKPIIIVCPATVMKQWVNEFHRWWPPLRVSILHTSGSGMLNLQREASMEDELGSTSYRRKETLSKGHKSAKRIVEKVRRDGHVLVTTYSGLQTYAEFLIPVDWEYAVLDEGHKIRNPNTAITIYAKELRTYNRIILSGTPMQNNLTELWSLFDFVFPMRLGTLVNFRSQFEIPIKQGGYANASNLQVETAMKCAETLKDAISPYLLQRFKIDVAADLPKKSERVLFCKLTKLQRDAYEWFLNSDEMTSILDGKRQALYGIDILRKICNHPDLVEHKTLSKKAGYTYGNGAKSGKMQVVKALLEIWKRNGHKTLLFAQHRIMLDILEIFIQGMKGFNYRRMDGNTSIKDRQSLVDEFNKDPDLHVFLLTTKVGGLGVNLVGADRVIIYDPDWNPSTDVQARERAWRLGQKREVEIYRLMTAGTIEEKIYHRQIFKQFLTNKILKDPKQRQTFQLKDLHDLFTLGNATEDGQTETGSLFKGTEVQLTGTKKISVETEQSLPTPPEEAAEAGKDKAAVNDIIGISRQEEFRGNADEEEQADDEGASSTKDNRMLSSIFARTGVTSALEHDAIINGKKVVRADPDAIAREAKKVASQAALELQRNAEIARSIPAGVPSWTGQFGSAGRPEELMPRSSRGGRGGGRGGGGPSSASVLANLQARNIGGSSSRSGPPSARQRQQENHPKGKDFLILIRDYLVAQGGSAYTQMLIDHFNRFCGSEQRTAEFKEMLKTIAELQRGGRGRGRWVLRAEFEPKSA